MRALEVARRFAHSCWMNTDIQPARHRDHPAVIATLADAFFCDPAMRWIMPDDAKRRAMLPKLFRILVASDDRAGLVARSANDEAAALWRGPGQAAGGAAEFWLSLLPYLAVLRTTLRRALK
ncbi:MAG: hypothetical protein HC788_13110 [Sphingopyxis sp.]|nr:hypothetical protein [Sphingopyxis sp.]